jgi:hypothetical protein
VSLAGQGAPRSRGRPRFSTHEPLGLTFLVIVASPLGSMLPQWEIQSLEAITLGSRCRCGGGYYSSCRLWNFSARSIWAIYAALHVMMLLSFD